MIEKVPKKALLKNKDISKFLKSIPDTQRFLKFLKSIPGTKRFQKVP
jgi:hypothetical protein